MLQATANGPCERVTQFLRSHKSNLANVIAKITSAGNGMITIEALQPDPRQLVGATECRAFAEQLERKEVRLADCFTTLSAAATVVSVVRWTKSKRLLDGLRRGSRT
jgi:hypothetical protein